MARRTAPEVSQPMVKHGNNDAARETFESIVVAFVLAFLFRTFIAEAFVIPTGSMAPTLFGRHKDITCPGCGLHYEVGASAELDQDEGTWLLRRIDGATCPNCRYTASIHDLPVFKGDRILVNKFPYEIGEPSRWDVCVFKFPEVPERNYIKRLIGLPGETIRISRGDVLAKARNAAEFRLLRKDDPSKQDDLQILVYDDAHPPRSLIDKGWPECWSGMASEAGPQAVAGWTPAADLWKRDAAQRTFRCDEAADWQWLRYRHFVPSRLDWEAVKENQELGPAPRPQLITDHYAYNTFSDGFRDNGDDDVFWVGDLTVTGNVHIENVGKDAAVLLELVEGVRHYRCQIDVQSGQATLTHNDDLSQQGDSIMLGTAATPLKGAGRYRMRFANVDDRLCLWINGRLIDFGEGAIYKPAALPDPQEDDLTPIGIATRGVTATVSDLLIRRDIYYRAERVADDAQVADKAAVGEDVDAFVQNQLRDFLSNPQEYARVYDNKCGPIEFAALRDGEFFVMGDNSPQSQDSRLWPNRRQAINRHAVPRNAMVGKAFVIYWPHGIPFLNDGKGYPIVQHSIPKNHNVENYPACTAPFYPQFSRWFHRIR